MRIAGSGDAPGRALPRRAARLLSLAALLAAWAIAAAFAGRPDLLPAPWDVALVVRRELENGQLIQHLAATLWRVAAAFLVAMAAGAAIGVALGRSERLDRWADLWLIVLLNLPALVVIVLCYVWIGLNEAAAIAAVAINKIPTVAVLMREGARALDPKLDALANVFAMPAGRRLRHVVLPQLAPALAASARSGVSLIWKIVLVVEFLGRSNGIGFKIHMHFQLFDVASILAYSLSFIAVMLAIEFALMQPLERRANRWRRA